MLNKLKRAWKKLVKSLHQDGLFATVKKVLKTIYYRLRFRNRAHHANLLETHLNLNPCDFSTIVIFENNFGWNKIMKQRPQQIAENLPADVLMFYHSHEDADYTDKNRLRKLKDNLILIDLGYHRDILIEELAPCYNKYVMVYSTDYIPYERIQMYEEYRYKVIYEYVDDLNEELSGEAYQDLLYRHTEILKDENTFAVATANKLKDSLEQYGVKSRLITNGSDYDHFAFREYPIPADLKPIREKYSTVLCYYGALANWFNYDLIHKIAKTGDYALVLIGQDYDNSLSQSGILEHENVFFLGRKQYEELPAYGCNIDVFLIPFVVNEITMATSPVKLFEYMAMGKSVVTTALPECKKYPPVFYSENDEEFLNNLKLACEKTTDSTHREELIACAKENTWASKAQEMFDFVNHESHEILRREIRTALESNEYDRIILWRSPFGWDVPLFQRPQHIAAQFAKQNCLVFYEITLKTDNVLTLSAERKNLYLTNLENPILCKLLLEELEAQDKPVYVQFYSTNWSMSLEEMEGYIKRGFRILYEYIDDISPDLAGTEEIPPYILDKYNYVLNHKQIPVVTTAQELYNDVVKKRGEENMAFACNGVDYEFFQTFDDKKFTVEKRFSKIVTNGKINVCYYGALASWFDYDIIRKMDATGRYNIILIGIKYDNCYDESGIDHLKNVYFIGPKDYHILKYYVREMDILTIPFVINSITQATSPLKLFEYMALHKPIVTTAMTECKKYESVLIAESAGDFVPCLEKAYAKKDDPDYLALLDREARENDWSNKARAILALLEQNEQQ